MMKIIRRERRSKRGWRRRRESGRMRGAKSVTWIEVIHEDVWFMRKKKLSVILSPSRREEKRVEVKWLVKGRHSPHFGVFSCWNSRLSRATLRDFLFLFSLFSPCHCHRVPLLVTVILRSNYPCIELLACNTFTENSWLLWTVASGAFFHFSW